MLDFDSNFLISARSKDVQIFARQASNCVSSSLAPLSIGCCAMAMIPPGRSRVRASLSA